MLLQFINSPVEILESWEVIGAGVKFNMNKWFGHWKLYKKMHPDKSKLLTTAFYDELVPRMRRDMYCSDEDLHRILGVALDLPPYDILKNRIFRPFNWGHSCGLTPEVALDLQARRTVLQVLKDAKLARIDLVKKQVALVQKVNCLIFGSSYLL